MHTCTAALLCVCVVCALLLLQGTRDSYSPLSTLRSYVLQYNEFEPQPGPLELQVSGGRVTGG